MNDTINNTSQDAPAPTHTHNRYQLREVLGRGGMATVYRALDTQTQREVAIKVLYDHLREHPIVVEHFRREVAIAQQLEHPNIVRIYSLLETPDMLGLVMELHGFSDLKEFLQRHGPMPREQVVDIGTQVLSALQTAHELGIVHQDVKPHNILWDPQTRVAKLIDFGLAETDEIIALARPDSAMGTVEYSAPEQFEDFSTDARADLYSLAITLFELLSGSLPYRSETAAGVIHLHRQAPVADVRVFTRGIPSHLADTLRRAMAKLPEDRFESAQEMSRALNAQTTLELVKPAHSELWEQLKNNHLANPEPTNWIIYVPEAQYTSFEPENPLVGQHYRNEIIKIIHHQSAKITAPFRLNENELDNSKHDAKNLPRPNSASRYQKIQKENPGQLVFDAFIHKTNINKEQYVNFPKSSSGLFHSEIIPLATNLTFAQAENIRSELGKKSVFAKTFQRDLVKKDAENYPDLINKWNFLSKLSLKTSSISKAFFLAGLLLALISLYVAMIQSGNDSLSMFTRANTFFTLLAIALSSIVIGSIPALLNFNKSWMLGKLAFQENYLLQFNQTEQNIKNKLITEQHAELYHQLRSNRVRATYERIVLTLLNLDDQPHAQQQTHTILAQATDLATHISQLETRLTTQNQASIFDQLARLDAQIAQSTDTHQTAELIEQKTNLFQQLNQVDADRTELKTLSHQLLQLAANLKTLSP